MSLIGVTLFFLVDAHLSLAVLLGRSTSVFPLGQFPSLDDPMPLLAAAGEMYVMGLALAAPVSLALVLTDVLVGVTSRNMPQINVLVLSIPLKVLVAYCVLALSVQVWSPLSHRMFELTGDVLGTK